MRDATVLRFNPSAKTGPDSRIRKTGFGPDTTVPHFNSPAESAWTVGFRDSENGIRPGQSDSENEIRKNGVRKTTVLRFNSPTESDGRTDRQILYGRTGPDRRPLYNFDQLRPTLAG